MTRETRDIRPIRVEKSLHASPRELLGAIGDFFHRLGIFDQTFSLEYEGTSYRVTCDRDSFMVYRVNSGPGLRHHVPGWPVCLVNTHTIYEEHHAPGLGDDHCASGADIERWLEIIERHAVSNP